MGEVTGEGFDVSAGFGSGREGGGGAVTGGIRVAVAARKVSLSLIRLVNEGSVSSSSLHG